MIRAVVFDLGNVILPFNNRLIAERLAKVSPLSADELYADAVKSNLDSLLDRGEMAPEEFFRTARERFSLDIGYEDFKNAWCDIFRLDEGTAEIIRRLKGRYRLGILSNTNRLHFEFIRRRFPVISLIEDYHLSYEMKLLKPDGRVYRRLIDFYRCAPAEIYYTDDIPAYTAAAAEAGITAITFSSAGQIAEDMARRGIQGLDNFIVPARV